MRSAWDGAWATVKVSLTTQMPELPALPPLRSGFGFGHDARLPDDRG